MWLISAAAELARELICSIRLHEWPLVVKLHGKATTQVANTSTNTTGTTAASARAKPAQMATFAHRASDARRAAADASCRRDRRCSSIATIKLSHYQLFR